MKTTTNNPNCFSRLSLQEGIVSALLFVCLIIGVMGCKRDYKFSSIHNDGFGLESSLRQQGFVVTEFPCEGVSNATYGYAWRSWQGFAVSTGSNLCEKVALVVRDSLNKALNGVSHDELTDKIGRERNSKGGAISGMLRYNKAQMHGDLFVWLTPDEVGQKINYVVFLREEPVKK